MSKNGYVLAFILVVAAEVGVIVVTVAHSENPILNAVAQPFILCLAITLGWLARRIQQPF